MSPCAVVAWSAALVPIETTTSPYIGVGNEDSDDEEHHLDQAEHAQRLVSHRVRIQEDDFDVEDDEQHRGEEVLDGEPVRPLRHRSRLDTALVEVELGPVEATRTGEWSDGNREEGEAEGKGEQHDYR